MSYDQNNRDGHMMTGNDKSRFLTIYREVVRDYPTMCVPAEFASRFCRTMELLARVCPIGSTILDVGAWPGTLGVCLQRAGWRVYAVDKEPERVPADVHGIHNILRGNQHHDGKDTFGTICKKEGILVEHLDIERSPLPFATDSIDGIIFTEVIEHLWGNPLYTLSELNRVLKPKTGCMILSTPNLTAIRNRFNFLTGRIHDVIENPFISFLKAKRLGHMGHLRLYSPAELETMLTLMGFQCSFVFDRVDLGVKEFEVSVPRSERSTQPVTQPVFPKRSLHRRLIKRPSDYWRAGYATIVELLERAHPPFRQQVYVSAVKITDADYDRHHKQEVERLITENRCD